MLPKLCNTVLKWEIIKFYFAFSTPEGCRNWDKFMNSEHLKLGELGEEKAADMLAGKGYKILERNNQNKYGEIDIVALKDDELVFVEVRSKTGTNFGLPEETVKHRKKKKLIRNAKRYISYKSIDKPYRIDVIGVVFNKSKKVERIKHYKNITL